MIKNEPEPEFKNVINLTLNQIPEKQRLNIQN